MKNVRIQKYLADCGVASRRSAERMVESGLVKINNEVARIGDKIDPETDAVFVSGELIEQPESLHYYILYKPRGYVTTMQDEKGRKCVADLISDIPYRVYPVGRLDKDSEGLLLLTDDGALANRLMHPSSHIEKTYRVTVRPSVSEAQLERLSSGILIDGLKTAPAIVSVISKEEGRVVLQFSIHEGRNRQIRRMCEAVGLEVARLKRTAIGSVKLGMLAPGAWRELTEKELRVLRSGKNTNPSAENTMPQDTGKNRKQTASNGSRDSRKRRTFSRK